VQKFDCANDFSEEHLGAAQLEELKLLKVVEELSTRAKI